jgi:hypothetical protein
LDSADRLGEITALDTPAEVNTMSFWGGDMGLASFLGLRGWLEGEPVRLGAWGTCFFPDGSSMSWAGRVPPDTMHASSAAIILTPRYPPSVSPVDNC